MIARSLVVKIRGACELSMSWDEAKERVTMVYVDNKLEFTDGNVSLMSAMNTAAIIWTQIREERSKIYLGFQFI